MDRLISSERFRWVSAGLSIAFQVVAWLLYICLPFMILSLTQVIGLRDALNIFSIKFINDILSIGFFYLNLYFLTPLTLRTRRLSPFLLPLGGLTLLLLLLDILYYQYYLRHILMKIASRFPAGPIFESRPVWGIPLPIILISVMSLLLLTSISSGLAIYRDRGEYVATSQQMVIEKQEAELTSLKLQISPHFLFNTLNNLRWLIRQKSDQAEEAVFRLSDMMRYMIYQVDKGPVTLAKEIEYIENYVELQTMRLTPNHRLSLNLQADDPQQLIEPLLFIHFLENVFKHGIHPEEDAPISISLTYADGLLKFSTRNRIHSRGRSSEDSGLGIPNIKRRLALHYPHQHKLDIFQQVDTYCVNLTIQLVSQLKPQTL